MKKKKKYDLTVCISARNEGTEPVETIKSLYDSGIENVEVFLYNDYSDSWEEVPEHEGLKVVHVKPPRYGLYDNILNTLENMNSDKLFFCNARCRFTDGWHKDVVSAIDNEPQNIYTLTVKVLTYDNLDMEKAGERYGAQIDFYNPNRMHRYYQLRSNRKRGDRVDAILGSMAIARDRILELGEFYPLKTRGAMNQFISLKVLKTGGKVVVLDNVIGNIFREKYSYPVTEGEEIFNYAALAYILRGPSQGIEVLNGTRHLRGNAYARHIFVNNLIPMKFERERIMKMKVKDIVEHLNF